MPPSSQSDSLRCGVNEEGACENSEIREKPLLFILFLKMTMFLDDLTEQ